MRIIRIVATEVAGVTAAVLVIALAFAPAAVWQVLS